MSWSWGCLTPPPGPRKRTHLRGSGSISAPRQNSDEASPQACSDKTVLNGSACLCCAAGACELGRTAQWTARRVPRTPSVRARSLCLGRSCAAAQPERVAQRTGSPERSHT